MSAETAKIVCEDPDLLEGRLLFSGLRIVTHEEENPTDGSAPYLPGTIVPTMPHLPSRAEVLNFVANEDTPEDYRLRLVQPNPLGRAVLSRLAQMEYERIGHVPNVEGPRLLEPSVGAVFCERKQPNGGLLTTTQIDPEVNNVSDHQHGKRVGMHVDNWYRKLAHERIAKSPDILGLCVRGMRFALIATTPNIVEIANELHPGDGNWLPKSGDAREYFAANPTALRDAKVAWLLHREGEGYRGRAEVFLHDASSLGIGSPNEISSEAIFFMLPHDHAHSVYPSPLTPDGNKIYEKIRRFAGDVEPDHPGFKGRVEAYALLCSYTLKLRYGDRDYLGRSLSGWSDGLSCDAC